ncbi:MAG TPA: XrtA system polysaccharide chain length determinant [Casimicrobiaceae bacterium]|nr:XrtA system polysaccharide chain length determinant [Casimicrobiaceae bacterium]
MQELYQQILNLARGMWHRRWVGLAVAWVVAAVAFAVVSRIPEKYEASARVYVDTESLLRPLLAGLAIQPNLDQQVALMSRTLISRPNVEKLVRMADLDLHVTNNAEREELVDHITRTIQLGGNVSSNLYVISYRDEDPARAKKVVQSLLQIFVESSLGNKQEDTQTAVKFLNDQIASYEKTLKATEDKIKDFKLKYMGLTGAGEGQDYFARAAALNTQIDQAKIDLKSAEDARDAYKQQLQGTAPVYLPDQSGSQSTGATPDLDGRIDALKRDLDGLLRKYTDQHPDVIATKRLITQLEDQRRSILDARAKAAGGQKQQVAVAEDPVYQQLKISLANADAAVASARAKLSGLEGQRSHMQSQAKLVPEIQAQYTQLTRDYEIQKRTYDNLVSRRESANMGKDVQDTGGAQFRVIDPPRVSPQPVEPNRLVLLGLACLLSVAAGLFASLAISQLVPTFHDARTLREVSKRPILGMVSMLPSEALHRLRRRSSWLFAGGLGGLFATFGAVFAFVILVVRGA